MKRFGSAVLPLIAISQWSAAALGAGTQLPVPCAAGACGANANTFVSFGAATAAQSGKNLTVTQTSKNATLNWASFNIGADGKVAFQQPSSTAVALNRIYDASPSSIFGSLTANGQIYLLNANGFLFGRTSKVNVAGLLASSLNLDETNFEAGTGLLAPIQSGKAALQPFLDANGNAIPNTGVITVQSGAQLTATGGGRLLLAAPTVQNGGTLNAADGQIVLAAGQSIYLQASAESDLRGLIVEVDGGGTAGNQLGGLLSAPRGNITLTGLMVNQDGRISATTTVAANGSVRLEAADTVSVAGNMPVATHGGTLELGAGSLIDILPEYADTATAVDQQAQLQSAISMDARNVFMHGASIVAPSGALNVTASADPSNGVGAGGNSQARIRIDSGTTIDLAGSDAELPMSANLVTVQLRANEFKDDPTQRNGPLRGQTVTVDARAAGGKGTPIADVTSAIAAVGKTIAQRTEAGGTATFLSEGDIVVNPGASLDVSGGMTTYLGGNIQTTQLVGSNGRLYDIGSANPLLSYQGVVNPTFTQAFDKWGVKEVVPTPGLSHYEAGYDQGASAGTVQFAAPSLVLNGSFKASTVNGRYQRGPAGTLTGNSAQGGTFIIGVPKGVGTNGVLLDYFAPPVEITQHPIPITVADSAALPAQTLQLPAALLTSDGFTNTQIYTNTTFTLPSGLPLGLPAGSSLLVSAPRVDIDSSITDLGGKLNFTGALTAAVDDTNLSAPTLGPGYPPLGIGIGDGVALNVSGQWTNDGMVAGGIKAGPTLQDGGSLQLHLTQPSSELVFGNGVSLDADGGAWLGFNGQLTYGRGGSLVLDANPAFATVQFGQGLGIEAFGAGTAAGGQLALTAPRMDVAQGSGNAWTMAQTLDGNAPQGQVLHLYAPLFSSYGFSSVTLTATGEVKSAVTDDVLSVLPGTTIAAQARSWQLSPGYTTAASGGTLAGISHAVTLPDYLRPPTSVAFNVLRLPGDVPLGASNYGVIDVAQGASIVTDPGGSISLSGEGDITVSGTLRAPGGNISVQLLSPLAFNSATAPGFDPGYVPDLGISLAPTSVIDVSGGAAVLTPNSQGLLLGTLRAGGSVNINAQRGTVLMDAGSFIDFSGSSALLDVVNPGRVGGYARETVASPGGSLTVGSVESIALLSTMNGRAGVGNSGSAAAGSLEIDLTRSEIIPGQPDMFGLPLQIDVVGSTAGRDPTLRVNLATIGVTQIENSGIDSLTLNTAGTTLGNIEFQTSQPLTLAREIILESRSVSVANGVTATLAAPYVEFANPQAARTEASHAPTPVAGAGSLAVTAEQITLMGNVALQNMGNAVLSSSGDVQLQGAGTVASEDLDPRGTVPPGGQLIGSLLTAGNLTLNAARIYPDTYTNFTLQAGAGGANTGTVTIGRTTASPGAPLSAGGTINIIATDIDIAGTLFAPFGQINLSASDGLTLTDGSLVSVSGAGLTVPFGQTQAGGREWIYTTTNGGTATVGGAPSKQLTLSAPNITVQPSATVDLRGGGDVYATNGYPGRAAARTVSPGPAPARSRGCMPSCRRPADRPHPSIRRSRGRSTPIKRCI